MPRSVAVGRGEKNRLGRASELREELSDSVASRSPGGAEEQVCFALAQDSSGDRGKVTCAGERSFEPASTAGRFFRRNIAKTSRPPPRRTL